MFSSEMWQLPDVEKWKSDKAFLNFQQTGKIVNEQEVMPEINLRDISTK